MKIIYEPHPVTPARKKELREQGYTIVDAIYKPEGEDEPNGDEGSVETGDAAGKAAPRGKRGAKAAE
jgi:hypothetical protein